MGENLIETSIASSIFKEKAQSHLPQKNTSRILLVVHPGFTLTQGEQIKACIPDAQYIMAAENEILAKIKGVNALIGCPRHIFIQQLLKEAGPSLRWVHASGAGIEDFLFPEFMASDITLTNGQITQGPEIADHAMALLLSLTRNICLVLRRENNEPLPRPIELRGKTALVVGLGGVGFLVAERAASFGMRVWGVDIDYVPLSAIFEKFFLVEKLDEALPHADVVFICVPLTAQTEALFERERFRLMKPVSYLINVARGKVVNTDDLAQALELRQLAGAGLDVTDPEPLPADHPLFKLKNVLITPHIAGLSEYNRQRSFDLIVSNIKRFVEGSPLINVVNKKLGF